MSIYVVYDLLHSLRTSYLELILKTSRRAEIRHLGNRYVPFLKLCTTTHLGILILDANGCTSNLHRLIQGTCDKCPLLVPSKAAHHDYHIPKSILSAMHLLRLRW